MRNILTSDYEGDVCACWTCWCGKWNGPVIRLFWRKPLVQRRLCMPTNIDNLSKLMLLLMRGYFWALGSEFLFLSAEFRHFPFLLGSNPFRLCPEHQGTHRGNPKGTPCTRVLRTYVGIVALSWSRCTFFPPHTIKQPDEPSNSGSRGILGRRRGHGCQQSRSGTSKRLPSSRWPRRFSIRGHWHWRRGTPGAVNVDTSRPLLPRPSRLVMAINNGVPSPKRSTVHNAELPRRVGVSWPRIYHGCIVREHAPTISHHTTILNSTNKQK